MNAVNIFILRHGEAGKPATIPSKDFERGLTVSGKEEVKEVAESLRKLRVEFDKIATSPLKRAYATAEIVASEHKKSSKLETWDELKPEGSKLQLMQRLSKLRQDGNVLIIGHEPYLSTFIGEIISGSAGSRISLKKSGLAKIQITSYSPKMMGELKWLLTPKHLKRMN